MKTPPSNRLFVITGGPGSGKSSLVSSLAARGISVMPEAGRANLRNQVAIGGQALPWADRVQFAELMLSWELRSYRAALELDRLVVFDRGIPDVIGYLRLVGLAEPVHMVKAAETFRYNPRVFIAPPWPKIFVQDRERKQSLAEAEATYKAMIDIYSSMGHDLIHLPLASVDERTQFVMNAMGV
jgi:predicted ATPase